LSEKFERKVPLARRQFVWKEVCVSVFLAVAPGGDQEIVVDVYGDVQGLILAPFEAGLDEASTVPIGGENLRPCFGVVDQECSPVSANVGQAQKGV
jgi:hypothetical protein